MAEWSIAAVLKTVVRATGPGVRIPLSPQSLNAPLFAGHFCFDKAPEKACFRKALQAKQKDPKGHLSSAVSSPGDHRRNPTGITIRRMAESNPPPGITGVIPYAYSA